MSWARPVLPARRWPSSSGPGPSIVLLDMKLSPAADNDGLGLCARLTTLYPGLRVLVLSTFVDDALVVSAIQHGACGYVVKDVDTMELVRSIRLVARNGSAFDSRSAAAMVRSIHAPPARSPLTGRELSVLRLVANGLSNRGIGAQLHLSETTVKFHVRNIMRKLDATSRAEAVYKATRNGLDLTSAELYPAVSTSQPPWYSCTEQRWPVLRPAD